MPKIGAPKEEIERPYVLRCVKCGCMGLSRLVTRFTMQGKPAGKIYACDQWPAAHRCDSEHHDGCKPERVYVGVMHTVDARTEDGTVNRHPGTRATCSMNQCVDERAQIHVHILQITPPHALPYNERHNGFVEDCPDPRCALTPGAVSLAEDMADPWEPFKREAADWPQGYSNEPEVG